MVLCIDVCRDGQVYVLHILHCFRHPAFSSKEKNTLHFHLNYILFYVLNLAGKQIRQCLPRQHSGEYCWCGMSMRGPWVFSSKGRMNRAAMRQKKLFCPDNITVQHWRGSRVIGFYWRLGKFCLEKLKQSKSSSPLMYNVPIPSMHVARDMLR